LLTEIPVVFLGSALGSIVGSADGGGGGGAAFGAISLVGIGSLGVGNFQKIVATGDIIAAGEYRALSQSTRTRSNARMTDLQKAINNATDAITLELPTKSKIAVVSIESSDKNLSEQIIDELEYIFVSSKNFTIVSRRSLDTVMTEQNFQLSGNVDDNEAVSIGKMLGATIVITGSVGRVGSNQRLIVKALDVKTAEILTMAREQF
jgi:TolB-like protein